MMAVDSVAIKLPTFWTSNPAVWFAQAEAQFALRGISQDDTKYYHVVAALDSATATRAMSILTAPPNMQKYDSIKMFLTSAYSLTEAERASALLSLNGLGDSKPSELMDHMLSLLGDHQSCFIFKQIFLQQLPDHVRAPLANSTIGDCRSLAYEADKFFISAKSQHISNVIPSQQNEPVDSLCWYHHRFGNTAKKCNPTCKYFAKFNSTKQGNAKAGQQ